MRFCSGAAFGSLSAALTLVALLTGCGPKEEATQAETTPAPARSPSGEVQAVSGAPAAPNNVMESASGLDPTKAGKSEVRQAD